MSNFKLFPLFILLGILSFNALGQKNFKIIQSSNDNVEVLFCDEELEASKTGILNKSNDSLVLGWRCIKNTLHEDWDYSLCEYGRCFAGIPSHSVIRPIAPKTEGFLNLHLDPNLISGKGEVIIQVYELDEPKNQKYLTFTVEAKKR